MVAVASFENAKPQKTQDPILTYTACIMFVLAGMCLAGAVILVIYQDSVQSRTVTVEISSEFANGTPKNAGSGYDLDFEAKKEGLIKQARNDKLLMDGLYAKGATSPVSKMPFLKKITSHIFLPDPSRFKGVEELLRLTGQNQTLAKFLYLGVPRTKTTHLAPDYPKIVADGIRSEDIVIGGCAYSNSTCHKRKLVFLNNDLYVKETFTSEFSQINFTRVFYIPARALLGSLKL